MKMIFAFLCLFASAPAFAQFEGNVTWTTHNSTGSPVRKVDGLGDVSGGCQAPPIGGSPATCTSSFYPAGASLCPSPYLNCPGDTLAIQATINNEQLICEVTYKWTVDQNDGVDIEISVSPQLTTIGSIPKHGCTLASGAVVIGDYPGLHWPFSVAMTIY